MPTYMVLRGDEIGAHAAAGNGSAQHWVHTAARSMDVTAIASTKKKKRKKKREINKKSSFSSLPGLSVNSSPMQLKYFEELGPSITKKAT